MNFISTFEELDKLYESVSTEEPLTEGKIIDGLKKVGTRLKADVSTIVRCFAEISGSDALYDLATYVENKAVLKALQSGNEKVLNSLTAEDIEELEQDIKEYENAKNAEKSDEDSQPTEVVEEACNSNGKGLEEDSEIEIVEDEYDEDESKQAVIECKKCGALVIVDEANLKSSEDSDLVNVDDECKFCSEKEGYTVVGTLVPYEAVETEEDVEEAEEAEELV